MELTFGIRDRSNWSSGPWDLEPDRAVWTDEATDYHCAAVRNGFGTWCGYVAVGRAHPLNTKGYYDDKLLEIDVHGGLTFAGYVLSIPELWTFGFDCGHGYDASPDRPYEYPTDTTYRTLEYVRRQCALLATQLKELACSST